MKNFCNLIIAGLVAGMFSAGTAIAADPKGDDVETIGKQIESEAGVPVAGEAVDPKGDDVGTLREQIQSEAGVPVSKDKGPGHPPEGGHDLEAIGKQTNNPVGAAWMMWFQNDFTVKDGDANEHEENWNSFKFQPVMSFPVTLGGDPWNLIFRPTFQLQSFSFGGDRTTGLGDTALAVALGPDRMDGNIWGFGITNIFPTASEDEVGQEKWQAGPTALLAHLAPDVGGFNVGIFVQHWWSYAGEDDRADTSLTDLQYFIQYRLSKTEMIGMAPNIQYDWEADSDEAWTVPIGLGYQNVTKVGNTAIKYGLEFQYFIEQPDEFGPKWAARILFVPVIQSPFHR